MTPTYSQFCSVALMISTHLIDYRGSSSLEGTFITRDRRFTTRRGITGPSPIIEARVLPGELSLHETADLPHVAPHWSLSRH
ncbi:hypothetical protein J6590_082776 [Homalodisca vitripennis]|nr:hypothetical protein J6590_082776 [Homalodisca vitripennis]